MMTPVALTADDDSGRVDRVGAAEHRTEVAGLFDRLGDEVETAGRGGHGGEGVFLHPHHGEKSLRTVAVGDLPEQLRCELPHRDSAGGEPFEERHFVGTQKILGREEAFDEFHAVLFGAGEFPVTFEKGDFFAVAVAAVAQPHEVLDGFVVGAGDELKIHDLPVVAAGGHSALFFSDFMPELLRIRSFGGNLVLRKRFRSRPETRWSATQAASSRQSSEMVVSSG